MSAEYDEPRFLCSVLNQLFEIERKLEKVEENDALWRQVQKMKDLFAEQNLVYHNPLGEACNDTRTDVEVHLSGDGSEDLRIVQVIKPIIRSKAGGISRIVQKGVVVVESQSKDQTND